MLLPAATEWAARLRLKRTGREWCGPCPVCGGHDRFHVRPLRDGTALVGCRGCIDGRTPDERRHAFAQVLCTAFPERSNGRGARGSSGNGKDWEQGSGWVALPPRRSAVGKAQAIPSARAGAVWTQGRHPDSTPGATYLVQRRVWPPPELGVRLPRDCRWVPAERWQAIKVGQIPRLPPLAAGVLVFAYRGMQGLIQAVSCEAVRTDGRLCSPRWRRSFGEKADAWFVVGPGQRCYVEGECDALAARWLKLGLAGAACGGGAGIKSLRLPRQGAGSWLLPDGDDAGYDAAVRAHGRNPRLTVAWRESDGGDPAADLRELIEERMARPTMEGLEAAAALRMAWESLAHGQIQS